MWLPLTDSFDKKNGTKHVGVKSIQLFIADKYLINTNKNNTLQTINGLKMCG